MCVCKKSEACINKLTCTQMPDNISSSHILTCMICVVFLSEGTEICVIVLSCE